MNKIYHLHNGKILVIHDTDLQEFKQCWYEEMTERQYLNLATPDCSKKCKQNKFSACVECRR